MDTQKFINFVKKELGFVMENVNKVSRAVYGTATNQGLVGGVGVNASAKEILANYDQLNGYITKEGYKVKNRAFFDAITKKPVAKPKIVFIIKMNGEFVEHEEGTKESLELQVAKKQHEEKQGKDKDKKEEDKIEE